MGKRIIPTVKKLKIINVYLLVLIFSLVPFLDITRPFNGIMLQKAVGHEKMAFHQPLTHDDLLHSLIVIPEEPTNKKAIEKMIGRIDRIDRPVLELLADQQVKIRLFEGKLTDEPLLYHLKWDTPRGREKGITWENIPGSGGSWLVSAKIGASMPGNGHGSVNLELHEIGHTVYRLLMTSTAYALEIKAAWKTEAANMFPDQHYFIDHPSEYFAEAFAYYYLNEQAAGVVKRKAPHTYLFFQSLKKLDNRNIEQHFF